MGKSRVMNKLTKSTSVAGGVNEITDGIETLTFYEVDQEESERIFTASSSGQGASAESAETIGDAESESMQTAGTQAGSFATDSPEILELYHALRERLENEFPDCAGQPLLMNAVNNTLTLTPSPDRSVSSAGVKAENPSPIKPKALYRSQDPSPAGPEGAAAEGVSLTELEAVEEAFKMHYDDSSDEEDEGFDLDPDAIKSTIKPLLVQYRQSRGEAETVNLTHPMDMSFVLYVLGVMALRSREVKPYYQRLKQKHLRLTSAEFDQFKRSVFNAFEELYDGKDNPNYQRFVNKGWPYFLNRFRNMAKKGNSTDEVLYIALKQVLWKFSNRSNLTMIGTMVEFLKEKIILPSWHFKASFPVSFSAEQPDVNCQHFAITLLQHRLVSRLHYNGENDGTFTFDFNSRHAQCKVDITVKDRKRNDYLTSLKRTYPSLLDPAAANPDYRGHQSSIKKFQDQNIDHQTIASDMVELSSTQTKSYVNFVERLYVLLMQVEVARNPAAILIGMMMFSLITDYDYLFNDVFPADDDNKRITSPNLPDCIHPMTLSDAPKMASCLNGNFLKSRWLPSLLRYRYDNNKANNVDLFAQKQLEVVSQWYVAEVGLEVPEANQEEVLDRLCELASESLSFAK